MQKTKIEWCDITWNPVIGCKTNCVYCYAKKINQRFKYIKNWNNPEWREKSFNKKFPKKPSIIFVNSMSDIVYWKKAWMEKVINKIKDNPQHKFLFLTKNPGIYYMYNFPCNVLKGVTLTGSYKDTNVDIALMALMRKIDFISYEPLMSRVDIPSNIKWVICGMETGSRKNRIMTIPSWIEQIRDQCKDYKIPLFMKNNIESIWGVPLQQNFPKELII
jgi:protein gp37